ncbi:hypothetical protein IC229_05900 [Spirosoma sp. BT702]|uniref:DUF4833 domain-containing protein n=1 Tax=Spirosoma profusum TaxID=2771354 RepID=A0A926XTN2_9BACT|nr:hypothetical protein [Spirosoma profusum]MBD2700159.1 hypothetical protein [Spirosoma profusum]
MKKLFTLLALAGLLVSCATVAPYVRNTRDPFTGVRSRVMYVGSSQSWLILEALASANTYYYRPPSTMGALSSNHIMTLTISEGDTVLSWARFYPEKAYDVPEEALMQLKFSPKDNQDVIVDLPVTKSYHTIGGALVLSAKINPQTAQLLQQDVVSAVRINKVSTNQSDILPVDWYVPVEYFRAFRKGTIMLFEPGKERNTEPREKAPKKEKAPFKKSKGKKDVPRYF